MTYEITRREALKGAAAVTAAAALAPLGALAASAAPGYPAGAGDRGALGRADPRPPLKPSPVGRVAGRERWRRPSPNASAAASLD